MVSAAKLRRAQEAMFAARPYARKMMEVLNSLATRANPDAHPLLAGAGRPRVLLVVVTADKGLCGGFNANIIRAAARFLETKRERARPAAGAGGPQGPRLLPAAPVRRSAPSTWASSRPCAIATAQEIAQDADPGLRRARGGRGLPRLQRVQERRSSSGSWSSGCCPSRSCSSSRSEPALDYLYEPGPAQHLRGDPAPARRDAGLAGAARVRRRPSTARAWRPWTPPADNAGEMIERLTLYMNKVRQAAITKEIIEVVSGAGSPA